MPSTGVVERLAVGPAGICICVTPLKVTVPVAVKSVNTAVPGSILPMVTPLRVPPVMMTLLKLIPKLILSTVQIKASVLSLNINLYALAGKSQRLHSPLESKIIGLVLLTVPVES